MYLSPNDVKKPVRVRIGYSDGKHWLERYTEEHAAAGLGYVEVEPL